MGDDLWAHADESLKLMNKTQLAKVKSLGYTRQQMQRLKEYYEAVMRESAARGNPNPSATQRHKLMDYYVRKW